MTPQLPPCLHYSKKCKCKYWDITVMNLKRRIKTLEDTLEMCNNENRNLHKERLEVKFGPAATS